MVCRNRQEFSDLVLVPGHAIFLGGKSQDPVDDRNWLLSPFQKQEGRLLCEHVACAVKLAASRRSTLLIFSGGQTHAEAGPYSEAYSYWRLAEVSQWWGCHSVRERATTEEFARDSFENLLFSLCRFREYTGRYPRTLTVVGWKFKQARFEAYARALRWPLECWQYLGVNDPVDKQAVVVGETRALARFCRMLDGDGAEWMESVSRRNPFRRYPPYAISCPELRGFLEHLEYGIWKPPERFPWEVDGRASSSTG